jgi:cobalt transporter subunit CbtB
MTIASSSRTNPFFAAHFALKSERRIFILSFFKEKTMSSAPVLLDSLHAQSRSETLTEKILAAAFAGMLGIGLVYAAGFADMSALHNAAHDGRHSAGFPCH